MTFSPLAKKLRLHTVRRLLLLNAPPGFLESLGDLPQDLQVEIKPAGTYDFVHLFVKDSTELRAQIDLALQAVEYDALLWISYPKGTSGVKTDLNRDTLWQAMKEKGVRPVTQVAVDEVWSALRFRPVEAVGK
jgi:hypothetical protein